LVSYYGLNGFIVQALTRNAYALCGEGSAAILILWSFIASVLFRVLTIITPSKKRQKLKELLIIFYSFLFLRSFHSVGFSIT